MGTLAAMATVNGRVVPRLSGLEFASAPASFGFLQADMDEDELLALREYARAQEAEREQEIQDEDANYSSGDDDTFDASLPPPLPHLREISSLASWTVSSYKPGCGVAALRRPSPALYWQSDGPQPHTLNIHFFKLVSIAHIRVYLDFELDESYTPTKMAFLAGTGHHDLQVVREMDLRQPKGWLDVDLCSAGGPTAEDEGFLDEDGDDDSEDDHNTSGMNDVGARNRERDRARRKVGMGPTLRCFLVQLRILENHQNGKDTHLRGLQIFARDGGKTKKKRDPAQEEKDEARREPEKGDGIARSHTTRRTTPLVGLRQPDFMEVTLR